jgi:ribosomal protein S18 acetylase RimI-like enzyme
VISCPPITYRRIDPVADGELAFFHYRDASIATFGRDRARRDRYLPWLRSRVEEFPDGHLLAYVDERCIGQLELQVPYGLTTGYTNLFYVISAFRRQGFGRLLHGRAVDYFKSWGANRIELDVAGRNTAAIGFYEALGYRCVPTPSPFHPLRRMFLAIS